MLRATPQSQQIAAVEKLSTYRIGGMFMEMGTGKSLAAMMLALKRQERINKVVWFCPVGLKETVDVEISKQLVDPSIYMFSDHTQGGKIPKAFWYIVGIESMSSSDRVRLAVNTLIDAQTMVILDESSYCKNHQAERTKWITGISRRARYRLILTGTPIAKGIQDIFAQMMFLDEKVLGYRSFYSFAANHLEYSDRQKGLVVKAHNVPWLSAKIAPYIYQVTKAECLDLPEKLFEYRWVAMTTEQARLYDLAKSRLFEELMSCDDADLESVIVYRLFCACRQAACGFWNDRGPLTRRGERQELIVREAPHGRLDALVDMVGQIPEGERVVIWAEWIRDIDDIKEALSREYGQENVCELTGRVKPKVRDAEIQRFRNGARFIVGTPSTGGHGYTFVEASYAIFYAMGMEYPKHVQAQDRIHRIGQTRACTYGYIGVRHSIDERILELNSKKQGISDYFRNTVQKIRDKTGRIQALKELLGEVIRDEEQIA